MVFVVSIQQDVMILHSYDGINIDIGIATLNNMQFMKAAACAQLLRCASNESVIVKCISQMNSNLNRVVMFR